MEVEQEEHTTNTGGYKEGCGEFTANPLEPSTGEILVIDFPDERGREEHPISVLELRIKGQFEDWVRGPARQEAVMVGYEFPQEAGQRAMGAYLGDYGGRAYNWDGRHCRNARQDLPGQAYLLFLLARRCDPNVLLEDVEEWWEVNPVGCRASMDWALGNFRSRQRAGKSERDVNRSSGSKGNGTAKKTLRTLDG